MDNRKREQLAKENGQMLPIRLEWENKFTTEGKGSKEKKSCGIYERSRINSIRVKIERLGYFIHLQEKKEKQEESFSDA